MKTVCSFIQTVFVLSKSKILRIEIPEPCVQNWHNMARVGGGRFCAKCDRTVVDFTSYSDIELYNFFRKKENEHVCGTYLLQQVNRDIVPVQPHSRLYQLFVALGLSLVFLPAANTYSQPLGVYVSQGAIDHDKAPGTSANPSPISGTVIDEHGDAMTGAVIKIRSGGLVKAGASTNEEGFFEIRTIDPGRYSVEVSSPTYATQQRDIIVNPKSQLKLTFKLALSNKELDRVIITGYRVPLIDKFKPADNE